MAARSSELLCKEGVVPWVLGVVTVARWKGGTNNLKLLLGARLLSQVTHMLITLSPQISLIRLHWGRNSKVGKKPYVIKYSLHSLV